MFDIKRFSIHDGPGIRTTVFFKGCPLTCPWCHNPESQAPDRELLLRPNRCIHCGACLDACPHGAVTRDGDHYGVAPDLCQLCGACVEVCYAEAREIVGRVMATAEVMAEVARDVAFYDQSGGGVTFSGGEPLAQPGFLQSLLRACRERGIHTALDTCGYAPWPVLDALRDDVDLFLYDVKLMDDDEHRRLTGVSNGPILENLRALSERGHAIVLRVPVIPGINDGPDEVRALAAFAASLPHLQGVDLLPYHATALDKYERLHRPYGLPGLRPPAAEALDEIVQQLDQPGIPVKVGG
ncbi:MAG: glycyl-radical enzyme activating protein [Anaerolineae bacterium]